MESIVIMPADLTTPQKVVKKFRMKTDKTNDNMRELTDISRRVGEKNSDSKTEGSAASVASVPNIRVFRFKMSDRMTDEIKRFGRIHKYDNKEDFNEAWKEWINENDEMIQFEKEELMRMGYSGDIYRKIYKSVKYYYIKKSNNTSSSSSSLSVPTSPSNSESGSELSDNTNTNTNTDTNVDTTTQKNKRKKAIFLSKEFLKSIDEHIKISLFKSDNIKPSQCYTDYLITHQDSVVREINLCKEKYDLKDEDYIIEKIKKFYKNRYFICTCRH
jgi:vacuolar-type H+-ATPase catalytic subunit A/Vma1